MNKRLSKLHQPVLYEAYGRLLTKNNAAVDIFNVILRAATELFGKAQIAIIIFDPSSQASHISFNNQIPEDYLEHCSQKLTQIILQKTPAPPTENWPMKDGSQMRAILLGAPQNLLGVLLTGDYSSFPQDLVDEFYNFATSAVETFLEIELIKSQSERMKALLEVGHVVSSTLDLKELLSKIMLTATKLMRCETSTVYLVDDQTKELYFHLIQGDAGVGEKLQEIRLPLGTGLAGWCAQNNKSVIVPDAKKDPRFFKEADKQSGFITRSMICVPMRIKDKPVGVLQVINRIGKIPFNNYDLEMLESIANQAVSAIENAWLYENIQNVYISTIEVLATAIDAKDPYTRGHSRRVTHYAVAIADELNLPPNEIEIIRYAGLLHDVGKIGIRDTIIRKPGRLTDEEYALIKKHPEIGARIIKPVSFLADKIPGVRHHHEYYDGRGYPDHLVGEEIPLAGRIICVADAFDAMTTDRPYRKGLSVEIAIGELKKYSGKQFDPKCVEAFLRAFEKKLFKYFVKQGDSDELFLEEDISTDNVDEIISEEDLESQPYPPIMVKNGTKK